MLCIEKLYSSLWWFRPFSTKKTNSSTWLYYAHMMFQEYLQYNMYICLVFPSSYGFSKCISWRTDINTKFSSCQSPSGFYFQDISQTGRFLSDKWHLDKICWLRKSIYSFLISRWILKEHIDFEFFVWWRFIWWFRFLKVWLGSLYPHA